MNAFQRKRAAHTLWTFLVVTAGFLPWFYPPTRYLWIPASCWALWRFVIQYYFPGSFRCAKCRHLKCKRDIGEEVSKHTVICSKCTGEVGALRESIERAHRTIGTIRELHGLPPEFPIKYTVPEEDHSAK